MMKPTSQKLTSELMTLMMSSLKTMIRIFLKMKCSRKAENFFPENSSSSKMIWGMRISMISADWMIPTKNSEKNNNF